MGMNRSKRAVGEVKKSVGLLVVTSKTLSLCPKNQNLSQCPIAIGSALVLYRRMQCRLREPG